jgi:hypothetical protein
LSLKKSGEGFSKKQRRIHFLAGTISFRSSPINSRQHVKGLADEGELASVYADWELLQNKAYVFEDEHPGVPKHYHASNKIVARKR